MGVGFALRKSPSSTARRLSLQKPQVLSLSVFAAKSDALESSLDQTTYERSK
jgi:hypothetical protein